MTEISKEDIKQMIRNIVEGFSSIDKKVMELTHVSNEDFTALNNIMKNHHETTREIAHSTSTILEQIQHLKDNALLQQLRQHTDIIKSASAESALNISSYIQQLHQLNLDIKHISIPILNFKQNISTLRFLITNLKLNQGLSGRKKNEDINRLIESLNTKISGIQAEIPGIAGDIEELKEYYQFALQNARNIYSNLLPNLTHEAEKLDETIGYIERGIIKTESVKTQIEQKNQQNFQNLNQVITNLQYHDIIRQKIEHIQDTHKNILTELNQLEHEKNIIKKGLEYIKQIPGIAEIQAGQLLLTNKEYQSAIENISKKLIDTANTLEEVNTLSFSIFNESSEAKLSGTLDENTQKVNENIENTSSALEKLTTANDRLKQHINTHMQHYEKLEQLEKDIDTTIKEINKSLTTENEIKTITGKLVSLLNDINESRGNIGKIINAHRNNQLFELNKTINTQQKKLQKSSFDQEETQLFIEDFTVINQKIGKNCKALKKLDTQLKNTLENIKYYDFYEHEVDEIINQMNMIYKKILPVSEKNKMESDLMSAMEKAYTMQSQRDIHQHKSDENESGEAEDDNLELF